MTVQKKAPTEVSALTSTDCNDNYTAYQTNALELGYKPRSVNLKTVRSTVPDELTWYKQFIVWQYQPNGDKDKPKKMPLRPNGSGFDNGSSTDKSTYLSFEKALELYEQHPELDGIGFALTKDDPFTVVDLDDCFNGAVDEWAAIIIQRAQTWTELTPSGKGFHSVVNADVPNMKCKSKSFHGAKLEMYNHGRYFTITGEVLPEHRQYDDIEDGQQLIENLNAELLESKKPTSQQAKATPGAVSTRSADEVLRIIGHVANGNGKGRASAEKFMHLHNGGFVSDDQSADDMAYMNIAAFYSGKDPDIMRTLYFQSAIVREKSDREDYVQRTIDEAIEKCTSTFDGGVGRYFDDLNQKTNDGESLPDVWPEIVDPFDTYVTPDFPLGTLPDCIQQYCEQLSAQSGFDKGAYAFSLLVSASGLIDHRAKLDVNIMQQPGILWGAVVSPSGGGKSPVMKSGGRFLFAKNEEVQKQSMEALNKWYAETAELSKKEPKPPKPRFEQLVVYDTTIEALGDVCIQNPSGVMLFADELTGFIGQMDAYSGKNAASKDRGKYLSAFDGGSVTINRKNTNDPVLIDNFSVSILSGVQPEKLADMFSKSSAAGTSDGLFQRFLVYTMKSQGAVNYTARTQQHTVSDVENVFRWLDEWQRMGKYTQNAPKLDADALVMLQQYHNSINEVSARTSDVRFAEHLSKFPGYICRVALVLHFIECAAKPDYRETVSVETFARAKQIMGIMYRHSEAVYEVLEKKSGNAMHYVRTACEAILSKGWEQFSRGDLSRDATDWRNVDNIRGENAIDLLIELGWIADITPEPIAGKRGRRSNGRYAVNPDVHSRYKEQSKRIKEERAKRYDAIKEVAETRI